MIENLDNLNFLFDATLVVCINMMNILPIKMINGIQKNLKKFQQSTTIVSFIFTGWDRIIIDNFGLNLIILIILIPGQVKKSFYLVYKNRFSFFEEFRSRFIFDLQD